MNEIKNTSQPKSSYLDMVRSYWKPALLTVGAVAAIAGLAALHFVNGEETSADIQPDNHTFTEMTTYSNTNSSGSMTVASAVGEFALVGFHGGLGMLGYCFHANRMANNETITHRALDLDLFEEGELALAYEEFLSDERSNEELIQFILWAAEQDGASQFFIQNVIKEQSPFLNDKDFSKLFQELVIGKKFDLVKVLCKRYKPSSVLKLYEFFGKLIMNLSDAEDKTTIKLIQNAIKALFADKFKTESKSFFKFFDSYYHEEIFSTEFLKELYEGGLRGSFFDQTGQNFKKETLALKYMRSGDVDFIKKLHNKDLPIDSMHRGDYFFIEEMKECIQIPPSIPSSILEKAEMFAQSGCRTVIFTKTGDVYSIPGQDVRKLVPSEFRKSLTIHLGTRHASMALANGVHVGFYPDDDRPKKSEAILEQATEYGKEATLVWPCELVNDLAHASKSEYTNQIRLDLYLTEKQEQKIHQYVERVREECRNQEKYYWFLFKNCINFVQNALAEANIQSDFRNGIPREHLTRRQGQATWYTEKTSSGPIEVLST